MGKTKHGIYTWVKHGQLPSIRGKKKVQKMLEELEKGLIADYGGPENISTSQEILIRSTVKALGVPFLIELFINKYGPVIQKGKALELHPILGRNYLSFLNTIRQNLLSLKELRKEKADDSLDVQAYIKQFDEQEAKKKEKKKQEKEGRDND